MQKSDLMGTVLRTGGEISLHSPGCAGAVYDIALDVDGQVPSRSEVALIVNAGHWGLK